MPRTAYWIVSMFLSLSIISPGLAAEPRSPATSNRVMPLSRHQPAHYCSENKFWRPCPQVRHCTPGKCRTVGWVSPHIGTGHISKDGFEPKKPNQRSSPASRRKAAE